MLGQFIMEGIKSKSVQINENSIRYFEHDVGEGKPYLLLITGWPSSALILAPLMIELGKRYNCIAVELPGFGRSESLIDTPHALDSFSSVLFEFCRIVVPESRVEVFGYSLGGALSLRFASLYPQVVERIIVYSAPYNGIAHAKKDQEEDEPLGRFYKYLWERPRLLRVLNRRWLKYAFWYAVFHLVYTRRYPGIRNLEKSFVKEVLTETSFVDLSRMFEYPLDFAETDLSEEVQALQTPVLVLSGANDGAVMPESSQNLAKLIPDGEFVSVPDADHAAAYTDAYNVARAMMENYSKK